MPSGPRPVIGVTSGAAGVPVAAGSLPAHYVGLGYTRSVAQAGGLPLVLPAVEGHEEELAGEVIGLLDGLVLAGGTDIHPETYGDVYDPGRTEKPDRARDRFELALVGHARERDLPVLGICRGFQILNVAYGGNLDQHRPHTDAARADVPGLEVDVTPVSVEARSRTRGVLGVDSLDVYCIHHQAVDRIGDGLVVSARARDGIVEALEDPSAGFMLGVLWHPEQMASGPASQAVYEALVQAATKVAA